MSTGSGCNVTQRATVAYHNDPPVEAKRVTGLRISAIARSHGIVQLLDVLILYEVVHLNVVILAAHRYGAIIVVFVLESVMSSPSFRHIENGHSILAFKEGPHRGGYSRFLLVGFDAISFNAG